MVLAVAASLPYAAAEANPPPGRAFAGTFHWLDDIQMYLSYAQQAEGGVFLFRNKFLKEPQQPTLFNLEWAIVGLSSRLLGRQPFLAFRLVGLAAMFALLLGIDRWLVRAGIARASRFAALLLVGVGGGLGGLLFAFTDRPIHRCVDLAYGATPFVMLLANAHWATASALVVWTLDAFSRTGRNPRALWTRAALGTALGLCRPYDLVTVGAAHGLACLVDREDVWPRLRGLAVLGPVLLYDLWALFGNPAYALHSDIRYAMAQPAPVDVLLSLSPLLAVAMWGAKTSLSQDRRWAWPLVGWIAFALAMALVRPVPFAAQYLVGLGIPLLLLAARGAAYAAGWVLPALVAVLSSSTAVAWAVAWRGDPNWFPPRERRAAALALRASCRPGDRVLAPADIGLQAAVLTNCGAVVGHPAMPDYGGALQRVRDFYEPGTPPRFRRYIVDRECVTHVVLPGVWDTVAAGLLPRDAGFTAVAVVGGETPLVVHSRRRPEACPGPD
jgi:hypothetical protein